MKPWLIQMSFVLKPGDITARSYSLYSLIGGSESAYNYNYYIQDGRK